MASEGQSREPEDRLAEQIRYYRTIAPEYGAGRLDLPGGEELDAALEGCELTGRDVLEIACGPGTWTAKLARRAASVTALDSSPEMLALAAARVGSHAGVRFVAGDVFAWEPERRYDVVFFGFFLSHVPAERFERFFALVERCLDPGGEVLFFDDAYRTPEELVEGPGSENIERRTGRGQRFMIVKAPHEPTELELRLRALGWRIEVRLTSGPFFYGRGGRS
ncbi:MAG TPA: methyltransferase domain-containing protein [Solirubrobacteraceae bacterium]|jgi:demethylmenaquinone methyltransferase/2-methoxy-6-polyprenyl-1,4-benzoquinol methylase